MVYGLGIFSLRSREQLLGLPNSLSYSQQDAILTGVYLLLRLPVDALASLTSGHRWLFVGAWLSCFVTVLALVVAKGRWPTWARYALFALVGLTLLFGLRFQIAALFPPHQQDSSVYPNLEIRLERDLPSQISFETISWLTNETETNDHRRQELNGVVLWMILVPSIWAWAGWRQKSLSPRARHFLVGLLVLFALLALRLAPRGYAQARWGISYPTVTVDGKADCDTALSKAIREGQCCAYDVSAGGKPLTTLLRGECLGDPQRKPPLMTWEGDRSACISPHRSPKVIDDDC